MYQCAILHTMRINMSISKENLHLIDEHCKTSGVKRSTFLVMSALIRVGSIVIEQAPGEVQVLTGKQWKKERRKIEDNVEYFNPVPKPKKKR